VAAEFARDPQLDVIYGDTRLVAADGRTLRMKRAFPYSERKLLYWGCYMNTCSTFLRRRFIDEAQLLDETFHYHMDHEFFVRLARAGFRFGYLPEVLGNFAVHDEGKTSNDKTLERRLAERRRVISTFGEKFVGSDIVNRAIYWLLLKFYTFQTLPMRLTQRLAPVKNP
jgi:GT2 family glycosyltransferase